MNTRKRRKIIVELTPDSEPQTKKQKVVNAAVDESAETDDPSQHHTGSQKRYQKGRKRSSPIWDHIDEIYETNDGVEETYAKCKHCER